jgi:acyl-CoA thioester hydrolase
MSEHATPVEPYSIPIVVQPGDIDELGHVNNVVYLRWVQDAATAHWRAAATPQQQATIAWVVVRHEIDYRHAAVLGDALTAKTWVGVHSRRTFERNTAITRDGDGKLLARARTLWVPIDFSTGKVIHVGDDVRERFSVGESP